LNRKKWWKKRKQNEFAWKVSLKDIKSGGYNLDVKNPNRAVDDLGDPTELLRQQKRLMKEAARTRDKLKKELMKVLGA